MIMSFYCTPLWVAATSENYFCCLQPSNSTFIRNRGGADSLDCCSSKLPLRPSPCGRYCCGLKLWMLTGFSESLFPIRATPGFSMSHSPFRFFCSRLGSLAHLLLREKLLCAPCAALQDVLGHQQCLHSAATKSGLFFDYFLLNPRVWMTCLIQQAHTSSGALFLVQHLVPQASAEVKDHKCFMHT